MALDEASYFEGDTDVERSEMLEALPSQKEFFICDEEGTVSKTLLMWSN